MTAALLTCTSEVRPDRECGVELVRFRSGLLLCPVCDAATLAFMGHE
jgi:hypothetical protein